MKLSLQRNSPRFPYGRIAFWSILILLGASLLVMQLSGSSGWCLFRSITSHKCPVCGISSAFMAAYSGDMVSALRLNPLFLIVLPIILLHLLLPAIFRLRITYRMTLGEQRLCLAIFTLLVLLNWLWVLKL